MRACGTLPRGARAAQDVELRLFVRFAGAVQGRAAPLQIGFELRRVEAAGQHVVVGQFVDDASFVGELTIEDATSQNELFCSLRGEGRGDSSGDQLFDSLDIGSSILELTHRRPNQPTKPLCGSSPRHDGMTDLRQTELASFWSSHSYICCQSQFQSTAQCQPIHGCYHGKGELF